MKNIYNKSLDLLSEVLDKIVYFIFDIERHRSNNYILGVSSILLSIASFYTTYNGFMEYIPNIYIVLFITFGVQSLVLISSWQIGSLLTARDVPNSLYVIFLISVSISIYFSYTSLFKTIYSDKYQEADLIQIVKITANEIIQSSQNQLTANKAKLLIDIRKTLIDYSNLITSKSKSYKLSLENELEEHLNTAKSEGKLQKFEEEFGGSINLRTGQKIGAGYGKIAATHEKLKEWHQSKFIEPLTLKIKSLEGKHILFLDSISTLLKETKIKSENDTEDYISKLLSINNRGTDLIKEVEFKNTTENLIEYNIPDKLTQLLQQLSQINNFLQNKDAKSLELSKTNNVEQIINKVSNFLQDAPIPLKDYKDYLNKINKASIHGGSIPHIFETSYVELTRLNLLAIGSLLLAISIDTLILICGLLGARQKSFLDFHKAHDLRLMKERAIESILSMNTTKNETDSILIQNLKILLELAVFTYDKDLIDLGYCVSISFENINRYNLSKEIGLLYALKYVIDPSDKPGYEDKNIFFIHTIFFLWVAEKLNKGTDTKDLIDKFNDIIDELRIRKSSDSPEQIDKINKLESIIKEVIQARK